MYALARLVKDPLKVSREKGTPAVRVEPLSEADHHDYLIRSRAEILGILRSIANRKEPVTTFLGRDDNILICTILDIDEAAGFVLFGYGFNREMNEALLRSRDIVFAVLHGGAKIQFAVAEALEVFRQGIPTFKTQVPTVLWRLQRRRSQRYRLPPKAPSRILLNLAGVGHINAELDDISVHGMGVLLYPADLTLEPGLVMSQCTISLPSGQSLTVDVRIQHSEFVTNQDGEVLRRSGCEFIGMSKDLQKLIEQFIVQLDRTEFQPQTEEKK